MDLTTRLGRRLQTPAHRYGAQWGRWRTPPRNRRVPGPGVGLTEGVYIRVLRWEDDRWWNGSVGGW